METKTLKQLIEEGVKEVYLRSYGYTELSCLGNTWQPFGNKARFIKFKIDEYGFVDNKVFWCEEDPTPEALFSNYNGNWISDRDYDLECR